MRWSIVRLIWARELRDQLRDRRTLFMIAVLPVLIYPLAGLGFLQLAGSSLQQDYVVGIVGADNLLPWSPDRPAATPAEAVAWLSFTPPAPGAPLGNVANLSTAAALFLSQPRLDYPPLVEMRQGRRRITERYFPSGLPGPKLTLRRLDASGASDPASRAGLLNDRSINLLLVVPDGFQQELARGRKASLLVLTREKDDTSKRANQVLTIAITAWKRDLKAVRLARLGLPGDFDDPVEIVDPERAKPVSIQQEENLFALMVKIFPFVLVLWSLAGALYPAIDLCAGEKERGTMETLLISPAGREEIVWGKFLTIWVFSTATALLNLVSMALTTWQASSLIPGAVFRPLALFWGVVLLLPLSAFFSAVCLAVGAYARSSKEGQYYLMPMFLGTMPLIFLTLIPGVELNAFYSMVPVTGVALLLQRLMSVSPAEHGLWLYFVPVLAPMVIYSWLALRWAIAQFQREEVLFREAERLDIGLWLRRLLREKEMLPSAGEAIFCFVLILALRWISFGIGERLSLLARTGISQLAFVLTPPLFMAVILTIRPRLGLALKNPPWWAWPLALLLAVCVVPPLAELTAAILHQFPALRTLLEQNHPLTRELQALSSGCGAKAAGQFFFVLAVLPALCEELAFRGFILTGLMRGFRPWTAVLLSAFLFSVYQMNVFQIAPHFVLGVVLALIVVRCGSVLPAMVFHLTYNGLLIGVALAGATPTGGEGSAGRLLLALVCAALVVVVLYVMWRTGQESGVRNLESGARSQESEKNPLAGASGLYSDS
jgi:sodium transport system permease protein